MMLTEPDPAKSSYPDPQHRPEHTINAIRLHPSDVNPVETKKNLEKPLLRRKSDLPTDILTQKSLENYQRADEYLSTPAAPADNI